MFSGSIGHYRALYENMPYGVIISDATGRITAANRAASHILGRSENQLRHLRLVDLAKKGGLPGCRRFAPEARMGDCRAEFTLVHGDGSVFDAEVATVGANEGHAKVTFVVFHDITQRKRAEARANEQAQWLDEANEAIFVTDLEHRITYWNKGAERMVGWTAAEVVGEALDRFLGCAGISDTEVLEIANRMADWRGTISCRHRNGTQQVVTTSVTLLRDDHGAPKGKLCVSADITEHARLQEKFERSQRLQSIGMLAAGLAHDLNNILVPVSLGVPLLRERVADWDDVQMLDTMEAAVARAAAVVRQILAFTKGMGRQPKLIQVEEIFREVASMARETFPRSISIETSFSEDSWPVLANPTQLHQVLLNLCVNARDAMPDGGQLRLGGSNCFLDEQAAAAIEGARSGPWLQLFVQDTGVGIAQEDLPHIWEAFFTTKSSDQGTGLGLSTVRDIVESHGGFVSVESVVGQGTRFEVFLPATTSGMRGEGDVAPHSAGAVSGDGETIPVVEDKDVGGGRALENGVSGDTTAWRGASQGDTAASVRERQYPKIHHDTAPSGGRARGVDDAGKIDTTENTERPE